MQTLANHDAGDKSATPQAKSTMCMIVGWRRIVGTWAELHSIVDNGTILIRESNGFRVMHSEGVAQGARS
jgi:hypothetical protein